MRLFDQSQESLVRNHLTAGKKCTFIKMIRIVIIVIEIIKILIIVIKMIIIMIIVKQISNLYFPLLWKFTFRSQSVFPSESSPCIIIISICIISIVIIIISTSIVIIIIIISTISAATALAPFG